MKTKNEEGNKYGRLTVIKQISNTTSGAKWLCKCDCGNETIVKGTNLRNGTISCGCFARESTSKRSRKLTTIPKTSFNSWTVLGYVAPEVGKRSLWLCRCSCGNMRNLQPHKLLNEKSKSCGCKRKLSGQEASLRKVINGMKNNAKTRNYIWDLTKKEVENLIKQSCSYCGRTEEQTLKYANTLFRYNGLDRVNNSKGYTIDNVVPCCSYCNWAKRDKTLEEFKTWIETVYKNIFNQNKK